MASLDTVLFLLCTPSPQVLEQGVNTPHSPHWQCTEIGMLSPDCLKILETNMLYNFVSYHLSHYD